MSPNPHRDGLLRLTYFVIALPSMGAVMFAFAMSYFALFAPPPDAPDQSMTLLEIIGFLVWTCVLGVFLGLSLGGALATILGKHVFGFKRADYEAFVASGGLAPIFDRCNIWILDRIFGKLPPDAESLLSPDPVPGITPISLTRVAYGVVGAGVGVAGLLALLAGLSGLVSASLKQQVVDHALTIVGGLTIAFWVGILLYQEWAAGRYHHGDDPKAAVRLMLAFGRRRTAIRYLRNALKEHPSSSELRSMLLEITSSRGRPNVG